jgi:hypothetical protein
MQHWDDTADTFGRVKTVRGTSVVTRFRGVKMIPLRPEASFYVSENAEEQQDVGVFTAIECARIDRTSVAMAYWRGLCAGMLLIGFVAVVPLYMLWLDAKPGPDALGILKMKVLIVLFVVGAVGGILSYFVPTISQRERQIREHCGVVLGPAIDPAQVTCAAAEEIQSTPFAQPDSDPADPERAQAAADTHRWPLRCKLVLARCRIALDEDVATAEQTTDELLQQMRY